MDWQAQLTVVATTAYAMALGGVIGFERELKERPAGFRTHMLVSGAAALLLGIGLLVLAIRVFRICSACRSIRCV